MKEIIEILTSREETISTMESCTGGMVANEITNIPGASEVFQLGVVSYSNHMKEKYGIDGFKSGTEYYPLTIKPF